MRALFQKNLHFSICIQIHADLTETQNGRDFAAIHKILLVVAATELRVVARIS
jgi:hypothetical protein